MWTVQWALMRVEWLCITQKGDAAGIGVYDILLSIVPAIIETIQGSLYLDCIRQCGGDGVESPNQI